MNKGSSIHDKRFLEYLAGKYDIHLISYYNGTLPTIKGLTIHQIPLPSPELTFPIASMITPLLIRKIKPDIVIGFYLPTYGFYSAVASYHPLMQIVGGSDILIVPSMSWLHRSIVKYSLKKADLVYVDCEHGKNAIVELGYPADNIVVFPWGIDLNNFNPNINGNSIRKDMGWNNNLIIYCNRTHSSIYGLEYLISAIPHVIKKEDRARFLIIGSGPLTDKFKKRIKDLNIEKYVRFTGTISNDLLGRYLVASDIYVSPSLSDGTSVSLLEAMACGLPVVVTDVDAIMEWVTDGVNGFVVPKRNSLMLAQKIIELIREENLRKSFGKENRRIAEHRASWQNTMKAFEIALSMLTNKV